MGFLSDSLARIKPSATVAVSDKARALKAAGRDVIGLGAGEPDFDTPDNVKDAAIKAIRDGKTKYTAVDGIPELKAAIVKKFKRENGLDYKPEEISVGAGGKQVLFNALMATLNPGGRSDHPCAVLGELSRDGGALRRRAGHRPDHPAIRLQAEPQALEKAITAKTKWVILNSPSNPTGATYTRRRTEGAHDVLLKHEHVWLMTDDMYEHLIYDGFQFATPRCRRAEAQAADIDGHGVPRLTP